MSRQTQFLLQMYLQLSTKNLARQIFALLNVRMTTPKCTRAATLEWYLRSCGPSPSQALAVQNASAISTYM